MVELLQDSLLPALEYPISRLSMPLATMRARLCDVV